MPAKRTPRQESKPAETDETPPVLFGKPPTTFELASLAATFMTAGKDEDEAFRLAWSVLERAERELADDPTARLFYAGLPDELREDARREADPILKRLGVTMPAETDFPIDSRDFYNQVLPHVVARERKDYFEGEVWPAVCKAHKTQDPPPPRVKDRDMWLGLFRCVCRLRGWHDQSKREKDTKNWDKRRGVKYLGHRGTSSKKGGKTS